MINESLTKAFKTLGWSEDDDIRLEIAGSSTYEIEGAGTKWAPTKGTVKYNKDAFVVIKNLSRTPFQPSKENTNDD